MKVEKKKIKLNIKEAKQIRKRKKFQKQ